MNITILKKALEKYLCAAESDDEKLLCAKALEEIACVTDRYENADCWDNAAVLLPTDACGHFKSNSLTGDKATHAWRLIAAQDPEILADICGISTEEAEALIKEAQE